MQGLIGSSLLQLAALQGRYWGTVPTQSKALWRGCEASVCCSTPVSQIDVADQMWSVLQLLMIREPVH